jgi:hypothetical protein
MCRWRFSLGLLVLSACSGSRALPLLDQGDLSAGAADQQVTVTDLPPTDLPPTDLPPICSADNWCRQHSLPQGHNLDGLWGSGATDVWAVGAGGTILHWDGAAWSPSPSGTNADLSSVWGSGATDVWAVGVGGTILHWDGTAWSPSTSGTSADFADVWGSSVSDVWVTGGVTGLHWNGASWSDKLSGSSTGQGVWCSGASDVWVVGPGTLPSILNGVSIHHWDGAAWHSKWDYYLKPANSYLSDVWGSSGSDVWITGSIYIHEGITTNMIHCNATSCGEHNTGLKTTLNEVWGSSASDVWAVGDQGLILHWPGHLPWTQSISGTKQALAAVWGSSASDVWVAGANGTILHRTLP